ncbi:transcriptional regulator [Rivularia sp. PCC 7116]|uniref:TetR/AcrR family transcriptional regulator n=1 Tax=Rivularia sp. PCC 7116 TaxID=373994 RepID=UPI00029ED243|nr:TetR/AcrR family transcriptional regulator [Rivularia sp. PCC 7116]AFY52637.1 transcriptional regulator [Rivularia sp. PCC 7116]
MKNTVTTIDTKEQILNVAERLFAEKGFAGTSLRNVIREAGVNIAAVHYHFGSKEELFIAVVQRTAQQIVASQLEELAKYENLEEPPSLENILEAFYGPPLRIITQMGEAGMVRAQFMGRCRAEPLPIQQLADKEFYESQRRFLDILQRALPDQTRTELTWKLDLAIAIIIRTANQLGQSDKVITGNSSEEIEIAISRLVKFVAQGMKNFD